MNLPRSFVHFVALAITAAFAYGDPVDIKDAGQGTTIGRTKASKLAFFGAPLSTRPASAAQAALTDNTTGTAGTTLAATVGYTTVSIPIQLAAMTTSAADLVTAYTPGFRFKVVGVDFATTTIGAGAGASQTLSLAIGSTAVTGGVVNPTLTGTNTLGKLVAGTAVTAANIGTATDTISVKVAATGTVFTGGAGVLLIRVQNLDTADAVASLANLTNALRKALAPSTAQAPNTGLGLIAGGSQ